MNRNKERIFAITAMILFIMQVFVILISWIISAAEPDGNMRSLLSGDGIKWFLGNFTDNLASPLFIWLILLSISYGTLKFSGLLEVFTKRQNATRQEFALRIVIIEIVIFFIIMLLFTAMPHALLLSATGEIFPSSFSRSFIPCIAFSIGIFSVTYGMLSGKYNNITDIFHSFTIGLHPISPLIFIYILTAQLYYSIRYIIGIE